MVYSKKSPSHSWHHLPRPLPTQTCNLWVFCIFFQSSVMHVHEKLKTKHVSLHRHTVSQKKKPEKLVCLFFFTSWDHDLFPQVGYNFLRILFPIQDCGLYMQRHLTNDNQILHLSTWSSQAVSFPCLPLPLGHGLIKVTNGLCSNTI